MKEQGPKEQKNRGRKREESKEWKQKRWIVNFSTENNDLLFLCARNCFRCFTWHISSSFHSKHMSAAPPHILCKEGHVTCLGRPARSRWVWVWTVLFFLSSIFLVKSGSTARWASLIIDFSSDTLSPSIACPETYHEHLSLSLSPLTPEALKGERFLCR